MAQPIKVTSPPISSSPSFEPISQVPTQPTMSSAPSSGVSVTPSTTSSVSMSPAPSSAPITPSSSSNVDDKINMKKIALYGGIILILAFLGFNIFQYLSGATENVAGVLKPIFNFFGRGLTKTVSTTVRVGAEGTKGIVDATAGTITSGLGKLEDKLEDRDEKEVHHKRKGPREDVSGSVTQRRGGENKSGYCYIGEENGQGVCQKVSNETECMSGSLYSTLESCQNSR